MNVNATKFRLHSNCYQVNSLLFHTCKNVCMLRMECIHFSHIFHRLHEYTNYGKTNSSERRIKINSAEIIWFRTAFPKSCQDNACCIKMSLSSKRNSESRLLQCHRISASNLRQSCRTLFCSTSKILWTKVFPYHRCGHYYTIFMRKMCQIIWYWCCFQFISFASYR